MTIVNLIQKQPYRPMNSNRLFQFMLTARIELQVQAQTAGGMYLPLGQTFEKYSAEFGIYISPLPVTPAVQACLLYTDVENVFTTIERELYRIENSEALIRVLRWGGAPTVIGLGVVGLQQGVRLAANGTGLTMEERANLTAIDAGTDVLATT